MIDMATGLALEGNKVFVYAMAPFLSLRCIEQAKTGPGLMKLPICFISVGVVYLTDAGQLIIPQRTLLVLDQLLVVASTHLMTIMM